jgi:hypothetical protein
VTASKLARNPPARSATASSNTGGPHQLRETGQDGGAARRCCRETEPSARSRHLERLVTHAYTEMMNLVDDNEIEPVTDLSHMSIRALERGHRHRRQVTSGIEQLIVRRIPSMRGLPR